LEPLIGTLQQLPLLKAHQLLHAVRYYRAEVSPSGGATVTTTGFIVPVMASVLVQYK